MSTIKKNIPLDWKLKLHTMFSPTYKKWGKYKVCDRKRVFIFLAGFYQNLGDMAITLAQRDFLQNCYPDAKIILVPDNETYPAVKAIKRYIRKDDLITLIGGGNMSDVYIHHETARRHIIKSFPHNRIISFPQTMFFSSNREGQRELCKTKRIYAKHSNLVLFAREQLSYDQMKQAFSNNRVELVPDIVLSLKRNSVGTRKGIVCCLRQDKEQGISQSNRNAIIDSLRKEYSQVELSDTVDVQEDKCSEAEYENTLNMYWEKLGSAECVITDRLHGMIFCVITGTPCVVMDNSNHKISGVYQTWLQNTDYIRFIKNNDARSVIRAAEEVRAVEVRQHIDLSGKLESLREACTI